MVKHADVRQMSLCALLDVVVDDLGTARRVAGVIIIKEK